MGKGVVMYYRVGEDLAAAAKRAKDMSATILKPISFNELAHQEELWVKDPDGYTVVLSGPASWG